MLATKQSIEEKFPKIQTSLMLDHELVAGNRSRTPLLEKVPGRKSSVLAIMLWFSHTFQSQIHLNNQSIFNTNSVEKCQTGHLVLNSVLRHVTDKTPSLIL